MHSTTVGDSPETSTISQLKARALAEHGEVLILFRALNFCLYFKHPSGVIERWLWAAQDTAVSADNVMFRDYGYDAAVEAGMGVTIWA